MLMIEIESNAIATDGKINQDEFEEHQIVNRIQCVNQEFEFQNDNFRFERTNQQQHAVTVLNEDRTRRRRRSKQRAW